MVKIVYYPPVTVYVGMHSQWNVFVVVIPAGRLNIFPLSVIPVGSVRDISFFLYPSVSFCVSLWPIFFLFYLNPQEKCSSNAVILESSDRSFPFTLRQEEKGKSFSSECTLNEMWTERDQGSAREWLICCSV